MHRWLIFALIVLSCSDNNLEKKGFQVSEIKEKDGKKIVGLPIDSLSFPTRPRNVLLTNHNAHRLTPIYKVNFEKNTKKPFTGSNRFHRNWNSSREEGNNWNDNFMPGLSAVYGYNFVNISHHDNEQNRQNEFFESPVLIKTLYYPAFSKDTLNYEPVIRDYYMVSVYDEDSNKDGYITTKDLRRFYLFNLDGTLNTSLIPKNYSVLSSEYDSGNDNMYVFARIDENKNGQMEVEEPTHVFWIDLKDPTNTGFLYQ